MRRPITIPAIALGLLAGLLVAAAVGAAATGTVAASVEASAGWLALVGLGLMSCGIGLILSWRRERLGR